MVKANIHTAFTMLLKTIIFFQLFQPILGAVSCIGENGRPVDWFTVYKLPRLDKSAHHYVGEGLGYVYMDNQTKRFVMPDESIKSNVSATGQTLQQIYDPREIAYIMYDDETPAGHKSFYLGHTKGDLAFDSASGFWLIHSVPEFPPFAKDSYDYPDSGEKYGQSFLCVTFNYSTFDDIGLQLLFNGPQIYDHYLPDNLASGVPNILKAIEGKYIYSTPYKHVTKLQSMGGLTYTSFAKSKYFGSDLYSNLVAPYYDADLLVETWQNGQGKLPSNCSEPKVENVLEISLAADHFKETQDHSKWAISKSEKEGLVCIGDINRMEGQFKRGGGTLCINDADIWNAYRKAITSVDLCQNVF